MPSKRPLRSKCTPYKSRVILYVLSTKVACTKRTPIPCFWVKVLQTCVGLCSICVPHLALKTGMKSCQKRVVCGHDEHSLLNHGALHIILLKDHILLQYLDRVHLLGASVLHKHNLKLSKTAGMGVRESRTSG